MKRCARVGTVVTGVDMAGERCAGDRTMSPWWNAVVYPDWGWAV